MKGPWMFFLSVSALIYPFFGAPDLFAKEKQNVDNTVGQLMADLPSVVDINKDFNIVIWFQPKDKNFKKSVTVYMEQFGDIDYDQIILDLKPLKRKTIRARILKSRSGLAVVRAHSIDYDRVKLEKAINAGFPLKLSAPKLEKPIESGKPTYFPIVLTDSAGEQVPLGSTVKFIVKALNAEFLTARGNMSKYVKYEMKQGSNVGPVLTLRPTRIFSTEKGMVQVEARIDDDSVLRNEIIEFTIVPPQYFMLLMAVIGGMLFGIYTITKEIPKAGSPTKWVSVNVLLKIFVGAITGAISYLLVDWDVIGIKMDTTSAKGFVILGFMFSYVGIDTIIKKITEFKKAT